MGKKSNELAKTPKSSVMEWCAKAKASPKWDSEELQKLPCSKFRSTCTIPIPNGEGCFTAVGFGSTKKEAEHDASMNILLQLGQNSISPKKSTPDLSVSDRSVSTKVNGLSSVIALANDDTISDTDDIEMREGEDPIGTLTTFCQRHKLALPVYTVDERKEPGIPWVFAVTCTINGPVLIQKSGSRYKKKDAKKVAAYRALQAVKIQYLYRTTKRPASEAPVVSTSSGTAPVVSMLSGTAPVNLNNNVEDSDSGEIDVLTSQPESTIQSKDLGAFQIFGYNPVKNSIPAMFSETIAEAVQKLVQKERQEEREKENTQACEDNIVDNLLATLVDLESLQAHGGPIQVLQETCFKLNIKPCFRGPFFLTNNKIGFFLKMLVPPKDLKATVFDTFFVSGDGDTKEDAKINAAIEGLKTLETFGL